MLNIGLYIFIIYYFFYLEETIYFDIFFLIKNL